MTTTVTGRIVASDGSAVPRLVAEAHGDWLLTTSLLAERVLADDGGFSLNVPTPGDAPGAPPSFRFRVVDLARRPVLSDRELAGTVATHDLGDLVIPIADLSGLEVTHLTGAAPRVSRGNALTLLIDGEEAFGRIADDIKEAAEFVSITQLFMPVPRFDPDAAKEHPALVFQFGSPLIPAAPANRVPPGAHESRPGDVRPERLLLERASASSVEVRILLNHPTLGVQGTFWLVVGPPLAVGLALALPVGLPLLLLGCGWVFFPVVLAGAVLLWTLLANVGLGELVTHSHVERVRDYFAAAIAAASAPPRPEISVRGFRQPIPDQGVMHCKMVIVDGLRAVVVGSPFEQRYFDGPQHLIEDPRRGDNRSDITHDVSLGVRGPAVKHLNETLCLFWNEDVEDPAGRISPSGDPQAESSGEDGAATVQVVRTLNGTRFDSLGGRSEKGILESYLRAFAAAREYIYLETQYFTDSVIVDALVSVLTSRLDLELILMVNIKPDVPIYPRRQGAQIERLRTAGGDRVGAFTRWTFREDAFPWIAPVYLHSKCAVVDDAWATIGSANLDGLSLDYNLLLSPLVFRETTATEVNVTIIDDELTPIESRVSTQLRRKLWAEHLGFVKDGKPNPNEDALRPHRPGGWLSLWRERAQAALTHIDQRWLDPLPGFVLPFPAEDGGKLTSPRKHLRAVGVDVDRTRPLRQPRPFDFFDTWWTGELEEDTSE